MAKATQQKNESPEATAIKAEDQPASISDDQSVNKRIAEAGLASLQPSANGSTTASNAAFQAVASASAHLLQAQQNGTPVTTNNGTQQQQQQQQQIQMQYPGYYAPPLSQMPQAPANGSFLPPPTPQYTPMYFAPYYQSPMYPNGAQQQVSNQRYAPNNGSTPTTNSNSPNSTTATATTATTSANGNGRPPYNSFRFYQTPQSANGNNPNGDGSVKEGSAEAGSENQSVSSQDPGFVKRKAGCLSRTDKPYRCTECDWSFARPSDLRRHARSHGAPNYHCPFWNPDYATCPHRNEGSFNRLDVLKRHLKLVHFDQYRKADMNRNPGLVERVESGICLSCAEYFANSKAFLDHCEDCARQTPMEKWKYKKNGVIILVKKNGEEEEEEVDTQTYHVPQAIPTKDLVYMENPPVSEEDRKRSTSTYPGPSAPSDSVLKRQRGRPKKNVY